MNYQKTVLLVLLACALALGGRFVIAPALATRGAARVEPPVDIETGLGRARRDAALALARAPGPPFLFLAPDVAASTPGAGVADVSRCGEADMAAYKPLEPDPVDGGMHPEPVVPDPDGVVRHLPNEIKPAGAGYTGAMRRIDAALRARADPYDRALADWLDLDLITPPAARLDALVQDALAVSDARVYGLAYASCNAWVLPNEIVQPASSGCARLSAIEWARRDPGNGEPWVWALAHADQSGDQAASRDALRGLGAASRFDEHSHAGAAAVARLQLPDADLAAQTMAATQALGLEGAPFHPLTTRCRNAAEGDADLAATCARIAQTMYEHSDSFLSRAIGGALHKALTGDPRWLDRVHRELRLLGPYPSGPVDASPCADQRAMLRHLVELGTVGEVKMAQEAARAASEP